MRPDLSSPSSPSWPVAGWGLEALLSRWEEAALKLEGLGCFPAVVLMDRGTERLGLVVSV